MARRVRVLNLEVARMNGRIKRTRTAAPKMGMYVQSSADKNYREKTPISCEQAPHMTLADVRLDLTPDDVEVAIEGGIVLVG